MNEDHENEINLTDRNGCSKRIKLSITCFNTLKQAQKIDYVWQKKVQSETSPSIHDYIQFPIRPS